MLIDGVVVCFQEFDIFDDIGVSAGGTSGMLAFRSKSGNVVSAFVIDGDWDSG